MNNFLDKINFDCKQFNGYKPCKNNNNCQECKDYIPMGKRILIIKLAAMGDVLRTTPVLTALKNKYNPCHITWITDENSIPLLNNNPLIDRLLSYNSESMLIAISENFDVLLNFEKEKRAIALAKIIQSEEKLGFSQNKFGTLSVYNPESEYALLLGISDELKFRKNKKSYIEIIFEMAKLPYNLEEYILPLSNKSIEFAANFRIKNKLDSYSKIVMIHTGCGKVFPTKSWTVKGFVKVIDNLFSHNNIKCILLGGQLEKEMNQQLISIVGDKVIDAGCNNTIEEFIGLISCSDLLLSLDSLAMHIAIGLKKKTVILFGSTSHQEIEIYGRGEKIVSDFPCSPCYKNSCSINPRCMEQIDPQKVYESIIRNI